MKAAGQTADLSESLILEKTEENTTYYVFSLNDLADSNNFYNLEVKKVDGIVQRSEIIQYQSDKQIDENSLNNFDTFTGSISAYDMNNIKTSELAYVNGTSAGCSDGNGGGNGGGNGDIGGDGGFGFGGGGFYFGGGDSDNDGDNDCSGGTIGMNQHGDLVLTDGCGNEHPYITSRSIMTSRCGDGSGIHILMDPTNDDNCERIKAQRNESNFKNNITDLKTKTGLKKETGYIQKASGGFEYKDNAGATDVANNLNLPDSKTKTYVIGYMHTHVNDYTFINNDGQEETRIGIKIFSPADIGYFMDMLQNAQDAKRSLTDVYAIMVSNNKSYQLRFTGNEYQIHQFTDEQLINFRISYIDFMKYRIGDDKKLEFGFLNFISEKMNLKSVKLYRMNDDGSSTEIEMTADKKNTKETNCPN